MKRKGFDLLIRALIMVESGGNDHAIGDRHLAQSAYGPLQIRQPVCDDYNRAHGTTYRAKDLIGQRELSVKICRWYVVAYQPKKHSGRTMTLEEIYARTWNGGPNGIRKSATLKYWRKVERALSEERRLSCAKPSKSSS